MNLYIILQILISSIAATSLMTLFSYAVSASARKLYKEPVLLAYILTRSKIEVSNQTKFFLSWLLHYFIGLCFVFVYHYLWTNGIVEISWTSAFIFGAVIGIIGITGWIFLFELIPQKPNIDFKGYYIQLFIAHIIFSLVAFAVYSLFI